MQAETLRLRQDGESIECWDDDGELQCTDDIQFHTISAATSVTGSVRRSGHRDSISSRRSARSDLESNAGDEDWQVLLRDNDETATEEAIASAHNAGIPIPNNVPRSALLGGTIKKLGGKKAKKDFVDDWSEDLELPGVDGELALKTQDEQAFPETLRQVSSSLSSPVKSQTSGAVGSPLGSPIGSPTAFLQSTEVVSPLNKHREDDTSEGQDVPTIKVAQSRSSQTRLPVASLSGSLEADDDAEDFEKDFELPADDLPLKLSSPKDNTNTPSHNADDLDIEWAEGSIGVRFGGTKRDGRSTHSSSVSALSPSVSSCLTGESEDDVLDGLVLPDGPLNLEEALRKRLETRVSQPEDGLEAKLSKAADDNGDFFADLEIGDGNVFTSSKPTLNPNIKRKIARPPSPSRSAKTITFTNKPVPGGTRIPRLSGHDRSHSNLEPVSESGAPISKFRRPHSRLAGHSTHPSVSSAGVPSPPSTPPAVGRRSLGSGISREGLKSDPTTTSAQLLKAKRSMPAMRASQTSTLAPPFQRPPSRQDGSSRPPSSIRPKTPVDRTTTDSRLSLNRRPQVPFLPAGSSQSQSHHVSVKYPRHLRRPNSDSSGDTTWQRSMSHLSGLPRPDTPGRSLHEIGSEALAAAAKRTVTRPTRRRNFGDGSELESFDDLPTSASVESRFVKNPVGHGAPRSLRSRLGQSTGVSPSRTGTPVPSNLPNSSRSHDFTPRFARDTNASRIAREQRIASFSVPMRDREGGPLVPLSTNWKAQASSRKSDTTLSLRSKRGKTAQTSGSRPHLIKPMGSGVNEAKCEFYLTSMKGLGVNLIIFSSCQRDAIQPGQTTLGGQRKCNCRI